MAKYYRGVLKGRMYNTVETRGMFAFRVEDTTDIDEAEGAMTAYIQAIYDPVKQYIVSDWVAYGLDMEEWSGTKWDVKKTGAMTGCTGTLSGTYTAYQIAAFMLATCALPGITGRKFLAGFSANFIREGVWNSTILSALATCLAAYITPDNPDGISYNPGVFDHAGTWHDFTGGSVGNLLSTMRRRKPGYGI